MFSNTDPELVPSVCSEERFQRKGRTTEAFRPDELELMENLFAIPTAKTEVSAMILIYWEVK